jgi:lipopolysaccharide heptosyltransferase I
MDPPSRILIIKLGSIGDVVHTLPAVADLKAAFPDSEVDWLVEPKAAVILEGNPQIHEVIQIDTQHWRRTWSLASLRKVGQIISRLRARQYDLALDFQGLWKSAAWGYFSGARRLMGFGKRVLKEPGCRIFYSTRINPRPQAVHVIDLYKELPHSLGVESGPHQFDLPNRREDELYIEQQLASRQITDFLILNPGGGWETKTWAPENYALLHSKLSKETGLRTVLTWGPGEEQLIEQVCRASTSPPPETFPTTLTQFIALAKRARLLVGGDTGPLHLAAACRTPIVGIFGPTDPARNGPFSREDLVVAHRVPCGPCYKRTCPIYHMECLRRVQVQEVYEAVLKRLKVSNPVSVI